MERDDGFILPASIQTGKALVGWIPPAAVYRTSFPTEIAIPWTPRSPNPFDSSEEFKKGVKLTKDSRAICHYNDVHFVRGPIVNHRETLSAVISAKEHPFWLTETGTILLASKAHWNEKEGSICE
jgi:hypothetical protein